MCIRDRQWIYRAKKYYNMLPPDISALLIPIHYRIHVDQLKDLVEAPSVDEFLKLVTRTPYLRHTDTQTPASIETIYKDCLYRLYPVSYTHLDVYKRQLNMLMVWQR